MSALADLLINFVVSPMSVFGRMKEIDLRVFFLRESDSQIFPEY